MDIPKMPVTYFPNLFGFNTNKKKSQASFRTDAFLSHEALKNVHANAVYDSVAKKIISKEDSIFQKFEDEIQKLEQDREEKSILVNIKEEKENEINENADLKISQVLDQQVDEILQCKKYYYKRNCPVKIPFKSTATHDEHLAYLRAFIKFQIRPPKTPMEQAEYNNYLALQHRFLEEQTCMMNFSFEVMTMHLAQINIPVEPIDRYISAYVQHRSKRASQYCKNFHQEVEIPIKPQDPKGNLANMSFDYIGNVLSMGTAAKFSLPNLFKKHCLPENRTWFNKRPADCDEIFDKEKFLYKTPVSKDPNAQYLARKHKVSIVMSASAFKMLVNNHDTYDKEWTIPVTIKTHKIKDDSGKKVSQRVAYLDKPLVRKTWLPLQKKKTYYKAVALAEFTERIDDPSFQIGKRRQKDSCNDFEEPDDSFGAAFDEPSTSVSPIGYNSPLKKRLRSGDHSENAASTEAASLPRSKTNKYQRFIEKTEQEDVKPSSFLDALLSGQNTLLKHASVASVSPREHQITSNISAYLKNCGTGRTTGMPWTQTVEGNERPYPIKECPPESTTNVHYQLFSLTNPNTNENIPILIRHNIHGITNHSNKYSNRNYTEAIVVHPKIEGQAYFGIEVNSFHDVVDQWASLVTKPHAVLLQVHICTESGTLILGAKKRLPDILKEGRQTHINFQPEAVLASLYVALQTTLRMPTGEYLLFHSGKTEAFISLMKATTDNPSMASRSSLNLHAAYASGEMLSRIYTSPPWLALDTHVLTPFHLHHKKVPATFPMDSRPGEELSKKRKNYIKSRARKKMSMEITDQ